ncbi:phosphotransferase [Paenibacillus sp. OV219]|uniref:phosphotransferase n=1 Tax=Paenibacillus sp. OV219 TaxID=1884377 RepID=UPI0008B10052|nr:phosphotransferase [Paenibacillus sp. OV219]SEM85723.1 homoserine kinase type II [Paenibacillus sp. OV219]
MAEQQMKDEFAVYLDAYPLEAGWRAEKEESGMNNTTRMIYSGNDKYVLRVYNNHQDQAIVALEHHFLEQLQHSELPFNVPKPVQNIHGTTITVGPGGKLAALFCYISGSRPTPELPAHLLGLGNSAGELSRAFARLEASVPSELKPQYLPYYELRETYAYLTKAKLAELCDSAETPEEQVDKLEFIMEQLDQLMTLRNQLTELPHQWIHGDIGYTNALADGERIVGILDFEFCSIDVRAMELAIVLSGLPNEQTDESLNRIALFAQGYGGATRLTEAELLLLPSLVKLRMLDIFFHFAGRLLAGLDEAVVWHHQINSVHFICKWVDLHEDSLQAILRQYLLLS